MTSKAGLPQHWARDRLLDGEWERWCRVHRGWWPLRRNPRCAKGRTNECRLCRRGRDARYRVVRGIRPRDSETAAGRSW